MTSEIEALKTNEFHRRRKLRIQQVREQSKDIAKKIRQRAKVEKWRHIGELDAKKEQEYLQHQEKLVKRLEEFYVKGLEKVGASHRLASEVNLQEDIPEKTDLSKVRAKEAAAELRQKKQEKLDEQKKLLDRKVQAREAANEISREKSSTVSSKLLTNQTTNKSTASKSVVETTSKVDVACGTTTDDKENSNPDEGDKPDVITSDMATQWDFEGIANEWEPHIPMLSLPKDDTDSIKEPNSKNTDTRGGRKRPNLFALSSEMPSSLCGGLSSVPEEQAPQKRSLTLVSEYLQNRGLRLREFDTPSTSKKSVEDLNSIKQTIMRTRASKEGSMFNDICHVADVQVVPVPSWKAEVNCGHCSHKNHQHCPLKTRQYKSIPNSQINKIFSSIRPVQRDLHPSPVLRGSSPFRRRQVCPTNYKPPVSAKGNLPKSTKTSDIESALHKKNSVTTYNHSTRDSKDVPCGDKRHVVRDEQSNEDAYSQAMKEMSSERIKDKEHQKKLQDTRNKVAMTRQNVEKEYKDTMNFLSSLPKDSKPIKKAYMDEQRQQMQKDNRQQKLQYEYKKIEKEFQRNAHKHPKHKIQDKCSSKSKCPGELDSDKDFHTKDAQYSWMPVPEGDGNLVIHAIPTTVKEGKAGNVKFSNIDSYHEYRSRHKHTPPTKESSGHEKTVKRTIETIVLEPSDDEFTEGSSVSSDISSVENLKLDQNKDVKAKGSDDEITMSNAERIIIYKVLEKKSKMSKTAKSVGCLDAEGINKSLRKDVDKQDAQQSVPVVSSNSEPRVSFEHLNEGVYKTVNEKGDNVTSMYFPDTPRDRPGQGGSKSRDADNTERGLTCSCSKRPDNQTDAESNIDWQHGDQSATSRLHKNEEDQQYKCPNETEKNLPRAPQPSTATSTTSFKTATNIRPINETPDDGFIKLLDEAGQETGKFYIGASGLLNNDAYEVVIQLRKKDGAKDIKEDHNRQTVPLVTQVITSNDTQLNTDSMPKVIQQTKEAHEQLPSKTPTKDNMNVVFPSCSTQPDDFDSGKPENPNSNVNNKQTVLDCESSGNMLTKEPVSSANDFAVKDGYTPFGLPDVDPGHVQKTVIESGPATSTHTQTTPTSSRQRPAFVHMSSSTSTAYMSPPELVLPKFMKHNYKLNYDNYRTQNSDSEDSSVEIINKEEYCEAYEGCQCRRCTHARKITVSKTKRPMTSCRGKTRSNNTRAPPNSARSFGNAYQSEALDTDHKKKEILAKTTPKKVKSTCHKCERRTGSKTCVKSCTQKSKRNIVNHKQSRNCVMRANTLPASSYKKKSTNFPNEKSSSKPNLNPTIKSYVDKLLALNKDGLKALAVINQDCSSVGTPGSSIIEVNRNIDNNMPAVETKISLEQIKDLLTQQILEKYQNKIQRRERGVSVSTESNIGRKYPQMLKKKSVHKVKSLNISKNLFNNNTSTSEPSNKCSRVYSSPPSKKSIPMPSRTKLRSKSSPSPRRVDGKTSGKCTDTKINQISDRGGAGSVIKDKQMLESRISVESIRQSHRMVTSSDETNGSLIERHKLQPPSNISTQTSRNIDDEINFMKMAEDKLQNMEKIADLTEKCTIRLSNLAKVLEEVRRNKSLVYSQVSDSASDSDRKSDKTTSNDKPQTPYEIPCEINVEIKKRTRTPQPTPNAEDVNAFLAPEPCFISDLMQGKRNCSSSASHDSDLKSDINSTNKKSSSLINVSNEQNKEATPRESTGVTDNSGTDFTDYSKYPHFFSDIPKPAVFKSPAPPPDPTATTEQSSRHQSNESLDHPNTKRGKPPPALSRTNFKHRRDLIVPHELSTVLEVDSPMSAKLKNQSTQNDTKCDDLVPDTSNKEQQSDIVKNDQQNKDQYVNPDLLQSNIHLSLRQTKMSNDSSDEAKLQMMDLNKFNEIMLKPFISIREYAKQCNVESLDEGSNLDDIARDDLINDELSSLHSDASLPDVIAELLKRNIITEPFKFDTVSNVNSTTSESTLSMLALSKVRKSKKKSGVLFKHKDNAAETSDTLSVSSNPDLENAFKKLGMGWASSTLKKTKERLALSSSSNTSSSSMSQFKVPNVAGLVTDSGSSALGMSNKSLQGNVANEASINVEQQTSRSKSMTVHEFLTNELAKKITFTNKSYRNDTEEEFVSLYETKMPVDMKNASPMYRDERSIDSAPSGSNNRARTSTPVQIFKSMTFHSSSSSNISNGLFSNADDLSSVKGTSNSIRNHSTSDKDDLTIPNYSLRMRKDVLLSDYS